MNINISIMDLFTYWSSFNQFCKFSSSLHSRNIISNYHHGIKTDMMWLNLKLRTVDLSLQSLASYLLLNKQHLAV